MSIGAVIARMLWSLGTRAIAYSRRQSHADVMREAALWEHSHIGIGPYSDRCLTCGATGVNATARCPGPPAVQAARRRLEAAER